MSTPAHIQDAFDQIEEMNQIAEVVLVYPQHRIWELTTQHFNSREIAEILNAEQKEGYAPITEANVRWHRGQAMKTVREKHVDYKQGKFRCAIVIERGDDALFRTDETAEEAIKRADRSRRRAA